jgi:hypothetical protein
MVDIRLGLGINLGLSDVRLALFFLNFKFITIFNCIFLLYNGVGGKF